MPSLLKVGLLVVCFVFLYERLKAQGAEEQCSPADPVGAQHPVQGLLERFQVGRGCAARQQGNKETHVVALQTATNRPGNLLGNAFPLKEQWTPESKVTVFLKPLYSSSTPLRTLHLVLSSMFPITWWLKAELLPPNFPVLVQVSQKSTVQSQTLSLSVRTVHSLPFHLHTLHRWAIKHHGNVTSLIHTKQGNKVYIQLGEDPSLPAVCQLQSLFLFPNYMTSDLKPQKVKGCTRPVGRDASPEVHVIKLHSAGSGLIGSLQVEVMVSLVPPVATPEPQKAVLILSSLVPVNWVITATGVWGHIYVYSSNSVSPPFPPEPNLTMSSTLVSDLFIDSDPLVWTTESGFTDVRSYTEASLANRFVIQLAEGSRETGQERLPVVNCEGGLLSVTVDLRKLQSLSLPVAAMTLRDQRCQALSNGSHFLLALPLIFCGTEGVLQEEPRGILYKNMLLLWRDKPRSVAAHGENRKFRHPLGIHRTQSSCLMKATVQAESVSNNKISCFATAPSKSAADDNVTLPLIGRFTRGVRQGLESVPASHHLPVPILRPGPALHLRLYVTDSYEQTWTGPIVITADHRVFVEISSKVTLADTVRVKSCFVSPQSDPKKSPFWTVISNGCSLDSSLKLLTKTEGDEDDDTERHGEEVEDYGEADRPNGGRNCHTGRRFAQNVGYLDKPQLLRFSFILRPVYNESMQFVHCSVLLCLSDSIRLDPAQEAEGDGCEGGVPIPPLVSGSSRCQCEIRNLSRPMVVTRPISSLVTKLEPSAGQKTSRISPESAGFVLHDGLLMGIVFAAFLVGVSLMGGLWCIYTITGRHLESYRDGPLNQTHEGCNIRTPAFLSDQSSSSV